MCSAAARGSHERGVQVGADAVVWNLHRTYGPARLPLLLHGWSILDCAGFQYVDLLPGVHAAIYARQPVMLLAAGNAKQGFSWNMPPSACGLQLQQLGLCSAAEVE